MLVEERHKESGCRRLGKNGVTVLPSTGLELLDGLKMRVNLEDGLDLAMPVESWPAFRCCSPFFGRQEPHR